MAEQRLVPRAGPGAESGDSIERPVLKLFLVDDEAPARNRLRELLGDISGELSTQVVGEAANGQEALMMIEASAADIALIDVQMPEMNGLELARHIARLDWAPAVIFITAHEDYAVAAFDVSAADYLLKPVRAERLKAALEKAGRRAHKSEQIDAPGAGPRQHLSVAERGRVSLVPVLDIVYMKAELKYVTVRTHEREYLTEESLTQLEQEFAGVFIRVHRSYLVARRLIRGFERIAEENEGAGWAVLLQGTEEKLPVSRRQWPVVKQLASQAGA